MSSTTHLPMFRFWRTSRTISSYCISLKVGLCVCVWLYPVANNISQRRGFEPSEHQQIVKPNCYIWPHFAGFTRMIGYWLYTLRVKGLLWPTNAYDIFSYNNYLITTLTVVKCYGQHNTFFIETMGSKFYWSKGFKTYLLQISKY